MNILIINQHTRNHGDEAACLALIRALQKKGYRDITIIYNDYESASWNSSCEIKCENVKHIPPVSMNKWVWRSIKIFLKLPSNFGYYLLLLFKDLRLQFRIIKKADFIISAPGGPNLGKYKDPLYLWRLMTALGENKKYAIYSPSIGPFPNSDKTYLRNATQVLEHAQFVSLRDEQSYKYADELGIPFVKAIDTAYLEDHSDETLPPEIKNMLPDRFVVIVPHELNKWHPDFEKYDNQIFYNLFNTIIRKFTESNVKVVLLPQTFESFLDDEGYFLRLKSDNPNIIVIPSSFSSDVQQKIIELADFVVGARYHTIVFAINNKTHFYCLSYEHKMINMLKLLGMESSSIEIKKALINSEMTADSIYTNYLSKSELDNSLLNANYIAKKLVINCFDTFISCIK